MKREILKFLNFIGMVVVLGTQNLLHGSWSVHEVKPLNSKDQSDNSALT